MMATDLRLSARPDLARPLPKSNPNAGLPTALFYAMLGILSCITVVGIPIGPQCLKMAKLSLLPFGSQGV